MSSSRFRLAPNAFSSLTAISGDRAEFPFRKFDRAGLPMPSRLAASFTDMPAGMMVSRT
jgi:hypothetical protein